jgi:LysM repeat protein
MDSAESAPIDISDVPVRDDAVIAPVPNPITFQGKLPEHNFETYVVERGDTPNAIADKFGIKPETLLGGNEFLGSESSLLQTGVELIILPIDGVLHEVAPGDTLEGLAAKYDIPIADIIGYGPNNLEFPYRLYPDTEILVPGAVRELFVWSPPQLPSNVGNSAYWASQSQAYVVGTGTFVWPVSSRNFTQYYWYGHQAIDVGVPTGTPIYATDTGTVTYATWSTYCFGNLIVVNHGNGYESFYAHLNGYNVGAGQIVRQGQLIGWSGNTGCSSGPHLHFEIRVYGNRDDPCWYLPGGC